MHFIVVSDGVDNMALELDDIEKADTKLHNGQKDVAKTTVTCTRQTKGQLYDDGEAESEANDMR